MSEWKEYKLENIVTFQRGHDLPKSEMIEGEYPVAGSNGIIGHHNKFTTKGPGVTIGRSGNIGGQNYYESDYWAHNTVLYVKEFKKVEPKFFYYFLKTLDFSQFNAGSAVPTLNRNHIHELLITIPDIPEQRAIASILSSLDDKIDLLHRQNKTLEQLAETLFRQWFVEEAEERLEIGEVSIVTTGKGLKREEFIINGLYPILGANGEIGRTDKYLTDKKLILTGRVGTLGKVYISEGKVWISDNVLIIKTVDEKYFYPIYFSLKEFDFENINAGSTQPLVTQTDLKKLEIRKPANVKIEKFNEQCLEYFNKISKNKKQIRTLTQMRDTLLPKLMSGEIRLNCDSYD